MDEAYELFSRGSALLADGQPFQAVIPLERARALEPGKASIREALGRAYFCSGRLESAHEEFAAAVEIQPTNDYAHFGLALCLERHGDIVRAGGHVKLALAMRPDEEYARALERIERERERARREP